MIRLRDCFSAEPCNTGRQPELDLGKAFPLLCLAFIHCTIECTSDEGLCSGIPYLFDTVIGGPLSAPMYMFAMGVGMVYTTHDHVRQFAKRGFTLCIISLILNLCRFLLPSLIGFAISGDFDNYITPLIYKVPENDILMFAGGAFLVIALCIYLEIPRWGMLAGGLALSVLGTFLNGTDVHSIAGNILLGHLIGTEDPEALIRSYFPLCNWIIVPISGYVFGYYLYRVKNKKVFYLILSPVALLATVIYFYFGIQTEHGMFGEGQNCYYHIITSDVIISIVAAIGMIGFYTSFAERLPKALLSFFTEVSRSINAIYCIHWVLIGIFINVILYCIRGTQELEVWQTMLVSAGIETATLFIAHYYKKFKQNWRRTNEKEGIAHS